MRVLFCSYQATSMPGGGVRTQVLKTKDYLEKAGIDVELFSPWKRYKWSDIDLIHVFQTDMRNYFLLKALPNRVPLVVSPIIDKTFSTIAVRLFIQISKLLPRQILTSYKSHRLAFQKAQIVVARSNNERMMLEKGFGVASDKIRDVPNGVEEVYLNASPELFHSKYGLRNFVLYAGQIGNPRKNLLRLLKVANELSDVPFVLVGPILETEYAQRVMRLARSMKNVHILGRVSKEELISAYSACDVFVLPSFIEGTGLVALEAGLAGAKVVVTKYGGPPDYFKDLAIYVEPKSKESIKRGIEQALAKPRDKALQNYIKNNFLWDRVAKRLIAVYQEVISG